MIRPALPLAFISALLFAPLVCAGALEAPEGRITQVIDSSLKPHEPVLETSSMIVAANSIPNPAGNTPHEIWTRVRFWDPDGSNFSERDVTSLWDAREGSMAEGSEIFLRTSTGYRIVHRDPAIPVRTLGVSDGWQLAAIGKEVLIFQWDPAQQHDAIQFRDRSTLEVLGTVPSKFRPVRMLALEKEIRFVSRDSKQNFLLHRMAYPDFKGGKSKTKITTIPDKFRSIDHFGPHFAVAKGARDIRIVQWGGPGKARIYKTDEIPGYQGWLESAGQLAAISTSPQLKLAHLAFKGKGFTMIPAGTPPGFAESRVLAIGESSVILSAPMASYRHPWCSRLDTSPGRQLSCAAGIAREREGKLVFTVNLDAVSTTPVRFEFETAGLSATEGMDFVKTSGQVTLPPGTTTHRIEVPLVEDHLIEKPESLELRITGVEGAYCDDPISVGRIQGSGLRLMKEWLGSDGPSVPNISQTSFYGAVERGLQIGTHLVDARAHGFELFAPIPDNGGAYFYARGLPVGGSRVKICQFDAGTAELLEVFDADFFKREGDRFVTKLNGFYRRYGFYDGLPVISLGGVRTLEGGGLQQFISQGERSRLDLEIKGEWVTPAGGLGPISFEALPDGEIQFSIAPEDDPVATLDRTAEISVNVSSPTAGTSIVTTAKFTVADNDYVRTTLLPATLKPDGFTSDGNRLWTADWGTGVINGFQFQQGALVSVATIKLPKGTRLHWDRLTFHGGNHTGQGIAAAGDRLVGGISKKTPGLFTVSGTLGPKPKVKPFITRQAAVSYLLLPGRIVTGQPSGVRIYDEKTLKLVREIAPPQPHPAFGQSLAVCGNTLWVSAPSLHEEGSMAGKVHGYSLNDFSLVRTLESPAPQNRGVFGYSIAGSDEYLVIGEPASYHDLGAVWVFRPDGSALLKRLGSAEENLPPNFCTQVATRAGRIMAGSSDVSFNTAAGNRGSGSRTSAENPPGPTYGNHYSLHVWDGLDAGALRLVPSTHGDVLKSHGGRIALLDHCAVFPSSNGLEYYVFPAKAGGAPGRMADAGMTGESLAWPATGAPEPVWDIAGTQSGDIEVSVSLGSPPVEPNKVILEWSDDLENWTPLSDWTGAIRSRNAMRSILSGNGSLKVTFTPNGSSRSGFFRLRNGED